MLKTAGPFNRPAPSLGANSVFLERQMERPQWVLLPERIRYGMYLAMDFSLAAKKVVLPGGTGTLNINSGGLVSVDQGAVTKLWGGGTLKFEWRHVEHWFVGKHQRRNIRFLSGTLKITDTDQHLTVTSSNFQSAMEPHLIQLQHLLLRSDRANTLSSRVA